MIILSGMTTACPESHVPCLLLVLLFVSEIADVVYAYAIEFASVVRREFS